MLLSVIFLIASTLDELFGSSPPIIVSEETTAFTAPLTEDGLPDIEKYFREFGREDVTFENNAAVLLWQALWPNCLSEEYQMPMSQALGFELMPDPTPPRDLESGALRKVVASYLAERYQKSLTNEESLLASESKFHGVAQRTVKEAARRPWTEKDLPPLANWIKANESYFEMLHEMAKRPEWWNPSPSVLGGRYEGTPVMLMSGTQNSRVAAQGLGLRSMWHAGNERYDDAWEDIRAIFRLARFNSRGVTVVEQLVAAAIDIDALQRTVVVLQNGKPNAKLARKILNDLAVLQIPTDVVQSWDRSERIAVVEPILMLATEHKLPLGSDLPPILSQLSYFKVDWNYVLYDVNRWIDRLVDAGNAATPTKRNAALLKLEDDLLELGSAVGNRERLYASYVNSVIRSAWIADIIACRTLPFIGSTIKAQDRAIVLLDLTRVASALAVYRAEQGEYPEKLAQLVPSVLDKVPHDLYSDQPFIYERMPDGGYLLYSVFENGKDDAGTEKGGEIVDGEWITIHQPRYVENSDLVIRVPVPIFELPPVPTFVD